ARGSYLPRVPAVSLHSASLFPPQVAPGMPAPLMRSSGGLGQSRHPSRNENELSPRQIYFSRLQFLKFLHALVIVRSARSKAISALTSDHVRIRTCRLRTNADDRLPGAALGRVEGGDGLVEGRDVADVRPQSSVTHPLDDL